MCTLYNSVIISPFTILSQGQWTIGICLFCIQHISASVFLKRLSMDMFNNQAVIAYFRRVG